MLDQMDALLDDGACYRGRVHIKPTEVTAPAEAMAHLTRLQGDGWVCTTHRVCRWNGGELPADALPATGVLSAEIATSESTSVHLRYTGDRWLFVEIRDELRSLAAAVKDDDYAFDEVFVSNLDAKGTIRMQYRTWWRLDGGVYRPWVARFRGFVGKEAG